MKKDNSRLEKHRRDMRCSGRTRPLMLLEELTRSDHDKLARAIFSSIGKNPKKDPLRVYGSVLASWGVMCPHPRSAREYEDYEQTGTWPWKFLRYSCRACGSDVLKEDIIPIRDDIKVAGGK